MHITLQPQEIGFTMTVLRARQLIGWEPDLFLPNSPGNSYYEQGQTLLQESGRMLLEGEDRSIRFFDADFSQLMAAICSPQLVLAAFCKDGRYSRRLISYLHSDGVWQMSRGEDGYRVSRVPSLAAASSAALGFCGIPVATTPGDCRLEANHAVFSKVQALIHEGKSRNALPALHKLGASEEQAASLAAALEAPRASGMLSLMYCSSGVVQDAETYSYFVGKDDQTWILFPPAEAGGAMVIEQSSLAGLVARILVTVSARALSPF